MPARETARPLTEPLVRAAGVSKSYGEGSGRVAALVDVTVDVSGGELVAVTGPSGSGKTTLLHCLAGLTAPDAGSVVFDGSDLATLSDDARTDVRRTGMGFVFQRLNLVPALTVAENVELPLVLAGLDRAEVRSRTDEVLTRTGMAERAGSYPDALSGGQLQRVAIARAVATGPRVVWADEPTGALDSAAAADVMALLRGLVDDGTAVVVVSHDPAVAERADRVVSLRDGHRVQ